MERTQMIPVCTVVESLAGRDKGRLYVVVGSLAYPYVWIADGRKYNLDKPKKKNCRHLRILAASVSSDSAGPSRISNEWIRSVLNRAVKN
ncbi:KOW domain-containing RNA-binding protein [uncultured Megasphaera sp.]|uniref:KOW domain-containing RNA-binding protein n=1 Tax=uncultured Megasphaera sp. TaxID=165188 RepID=UPI0025F9F2C9|nr:KOW domain-containing RNA-binding protein [uncultured Megasphaera sp.]